MSPPIPSSPVDASSRFFRAWARFVLRWRWLLLAVTVAGTVAFAWGIQSRLRIENGIEAFLSKDAPATRVLEEFRDDFGRDDLFLVLAEGDVFSPPFLQKLRALHDELAALDLDLPTLGQRKNRPDGIVPQAAPPAQAAAGQAAADEFGDFGAEASAWGQEQGGTIVDEILSPLNVRRTRADGDGIVVGKWLDPLPADAAGLAAVKRAMLADRTLLGQVVGAEGRHAVLTLRTRFMSEEDSAKVHEVMQGIADKHAAPGFKLSLAGPPALGSALNALVLQDLGRTAGVAVLTMILVLAFLFRHPLGVVGPVAVTGMAVVWTFGGMAFAGWPMTMLSNILPAFLICVGIGDSVHIQSIYRDLRRQGLGNHEAIVEAVTSTGIPVLFTSLTTMVGLASFRFATVDAIGEMGLAGALGVAVALLHSLVFLPIWLSFNRTSLLGARAEGDSDRFDRFLVWAIDASRDRDVPAGGLGRRTPRRARVLAVAFGLTLLAGFGTTLLYVWHNPLAWVPPEEPISRATADLDQHVGGTANVQLLIDTKQPGGIKDVQLLRGLEQLDAWIRAYQHPDLDQPLVSNVVSLVDVVKETNRSLHGDDPAWYALPADDRGVADLLFLFENAGPDQLRRLATADLSRTQVTVRVRWIDATSYGPFTAYVDEGVRRFLGDRYVVKPTGAVYNLFTVVSALIADLLRSFGTAFALITLLLVVMLRNVKLAVVAMVPNLVPIVGILGLMGYAGIPIDMANLLIASIAIGIAVDDTIHFMHHFQDRYRATGSVEAAIDFTRRHSGRAMIATSVVLCLGFLVYTTARMENIVFFGLLIALTVVFALLCDLIFAPALLRTFYRDRVDPAATREVEHADKMVA